MSTCIWKILLIENDNNEQNETQKKNKKKQRKRTERKDRKDRSEYEEELRAKLKTFADIEEEGVEKDDDYFIWSAPPTPDVVRKREDFINTCKGGMVVNFKMIITVVILWFFLKMSVGTPSSPDMVHGIDALMQKH